MPLVGEKVLVKAVQDPLKPISWTAQKVQTLNGQVWSNVLHSYTNIMSLRSCCTIEICNLLKYLAPLYIKALVHPK